MTRATIFFIIDWKKYFIPADWDAYLTNSEELSQLWITFQLIMENSNNISWIKDLRSFLKELEKNSNTYWFDLELLNKEKRIGTYNYILDLDNWEITQWDCKYNNKTNVLTTINKDIVYSDNKWNIL